MSNSKNFGLSGVSDDLQFSKGGAKLVQSNGIFSTRNASGTDFVRFQVADAIENNDAINKGLLDMTLSAQNERTSDEIVSADGASLTSVKVTDADGVVFSGASKGAKTKLGSIVTGDDQDSTFEVDLSTAAEVRLEAASTTAADVDIHLLPQGAGQVVIGESGAGTIQAEDGYDLTVAGGDAASNKVGNLLLKGGKDSADGGNVVIEDGNGNAVATFSASGIDANSKIIRNLSDPVANTDAVTKQYVDSAIEAGQALSATGSIRTRVVSVSETTGAANLGDVMVGTVMRVTVLVSAAFASGSTLTVGTASEADALVAAKNIDQSTVGLSVIDVVVDYTAKTQLVVNVVANGGTTGAAKIIVEYISGKETVNDLGEYVNLMIPFNEAEGSTKFKDHSKYNRDIVTNGSVKTAKFGKNYETSAYFSGEETDYLDIALPFAKTDGTVSVEFWAYRPTAPNGNVNYTGIYCNGGYGLSGVELIFTNMRGLGFSVQSAQALHRIYINGKKVWSSGAGGNFGTVPIGEWFHVAHIIQVTNLTNQNNMTVGCYRQSGNATGKIPYYLQDFILYKGIESRTDDFTPPARGIV